MSHIIVSVVFHYPDSVKQITTTHIIDNVDAIIRQHSSAVSVIVGDFYKMTEKPLRDIGLKHFVRGAVLANQQYTR